MLAACMREIGPHCSIGYGIITGAGTDTKGAIHNLAAEYPDPTSLGPHTMHVPDVGNDYGYKFIQMWVDKKAFESERAPGTVDQDYFTMFAGDLQQALMQYGKHALKGHDGILVKPYLPRPGSPPERDGKIGLFVFCKGIQPQWLESLGSALEAARNHAARDATEEGRYAEPYQRGRC